MKGQQWPKEGPVIVEFDMILRCSFRTRLLRENYGDGFLEPPIPVLPEAAHVALAAEGVTVLTESLGGFYPRKDEKRD